AYPVDRSLERIQGRSRRILETYRRDARMAALQKRQSIKQLKYEQTRRREADVLRRQVRIGVDDIMPADGNPPAGPGLETPAEHGMPAHDQSLQDTTSRPLDSTTEDEKSQFAPTAPGGAIPPVESDTVDEATDPLSQEPAEIPEGKPADDARIPADTGKEPADVDPFGEAESPSKTTEETSAPTNAGPPVEVGQKVNRKKLFGILGGLIGNTIRDSLPDVPEIPSGGMPLGPGMGPSTGPGMELEVPPSETPDDPSTTDDNLFEEMPGEATEENPFGDDPEGASGPSEKATDESSDATDDPFADDPEEASGPSEKATDESSDAIDDPFADDPEESPDLEELPTNTSGEDPLGDLFSNQDGNLDGNPSGTLDDGSHEVPDDPSGDNLSNHKIPDDPFDVD
ncbi:MAG: hypothetical protein JW829_11400, partial [Pirellulales bacterium]|nr:hypothetical protein [Pirellulales bacterium]